MRQGHFGHAFRRGGCLNTLLAKRCQKACSGAVWHLIGQRGKSGRVFENEDSRFARAPRPRRVAGEGWNRLGRVKYRVVSRDKPYFQIGRTLQAKRLQSNRGASKIKACPRCHENSRVTTSQQRTQQGRARPCTSPARVLESAEDRGEMLGTAMVLPERSWRVPPARLAGFLASSNRTPT